MSQAKTISLSNNDLHYGLEDIFVPFVASSLLGTPSSYQLQSDDFKAYESDAWLALPPLMQRTEFLALLIGNPNFRQKLNKQVQLQEHDLKALACFYDLKN